eukprot:SAG25_NODE_14512_length_254_cov_0.664516_1_plen_45_part_10
MCVFYMPIYLGICETVGFGWPVCAAASLLPAHGVILLRCIHWSAK